VILAEHISSYIDDRQILRDISFTVQRGEAVAILGPNGAGKSTLLRHLAGLIKPDAGVVYYNGAPVHLLANKERARKIALLLQNPEVAFHFTALEIVRMARYPYLRRFQTESQKDLAIVQAMMEKTCTWHLRDRTLDEMSGGERQRVFLARALAQEPEILLLDEPTTYLDVFHQHEILDLLQKAKQQMGLTWVAVLHDLNLAVQYCDRILLLAKGELVSHGKPSEVLRPDVLADVYGVDVRVIKAKEIPFPQFVFLPRNHMTGEQN
jgi:iron complex transport system ATP-binding protein